MMIPTSKSVSAAWFPTSEDEKAQVREQLERLLAHPLFSQSRRYPGVLSYVVEQTLLGNADQIKERNIGIEVFDREPNYDANANPVVRFTASEIRKRLAQYYIDPAHASELQIDLPGGSYVPVFYLPSVAGDSSRTTAHPESASSDAHLRSILEGKEPEKVGAQTFPGRASLYLAVALCAILLLVAGVFLGMQLRPPQPINRYASLDQFWAPVTVATGTVTLCIGEHHGQTSATLEPPPHEIESLQQSLLEHVHQSGHLAIPDVMTLTHLGAALEMRGKPFRISTATQANFAQLREGPVILIGAFNNPWTLRLTQNLRFGFVFKDRVVSIIDRHSATQRQWSTNWNTPYQKLSKDYGVVARFRDPTTGQIVVLTAGIADEGTEAAGELLSNPEYFKALLNQAPRNWSTMNMEAVIETEVIDGHPGPPHILAVEFW
jgi:hypothetical protein